MQLPTASFPNLTQANHTDISPQDPRYNCHAWALGFTDRWFDDGQWWPDGVQRGETVRDYKRAYESLGFRVSSGWQVEEGFEKIAIYEYGRKVTHTARLLPDGLWASKIGQLEDIHHTREALDGPQYGHITLIMRRPVITNLRS